MSFCCMCKHFSNTKRTTRFKETFCEKSDWQFWVGCGHWDSLHQSISFISPCYSHMSLGKCHCSSPSYQGIPMGCTFRKEMPWQANTKARNGLVQWVLVALRHRVPDSPLLFYHKTCNVAYLIYCNLLSVDLFVIPEGKYWRKLGNLFSFLAWNVCFFD